MNHTKTKNIKAIVTLDKDAIIETGVPAFFPENEKEQEKIASELARVLAGNAYKLSNGVIIITEE